MRALLPLAALALLVSACTPTTPAGPAGPAQPAQQQYVALGDSYTAAPGIGAIDKHDGCNRSSNNYPHLVAIDADLGLTDVSCSGASTEHLTGEQQTARVVPPQFDALNDSVDLVSLRMGFNDFGLAVRVFGACVKIAEANTAGSPCKDADALAGEQSIANHLPIVAERLVTALQEIGEKAPKARVLVIGYPEIYPETEVCPALPVAPGDLPFLRSVVDRLNDALRAAAETTGADYIDVFTASKGHHICGEDPFVAGAEVLEGREGVIWHPYVQEQELVADLVRAALES